MNVVITMAGLGTRFRKAGWSIPKYQIEVRSKTLFEWSMSSLEAFRQSPFIFLVRREDNACKFITSTCEKMEIMPKIIELDQVTRGQAETALLASIMWSTKEPLLVYNIDTYVEPGQLRPELIKGDGFIPCFTADGTHWSFVRLDEVGRAIEVQEKVRISDHCSIGAYYFRSAKLYAELFNEFYLQSKVDKEFYIAPMYNRLIEHGGEVRIQSIDAKYVHVLGTPEEVDVFAKEEIRADKIEVERLPTFRNMLSLPVHERTECVIDQVLNIRRFCPDSAVVIHISKGFNYADSLHSEEQFKSILSTFDNIFVNSTSLDTRWADIVHTHVSNFKYVSKLADFKSFSTIASNELFVREMLEALPAGFDVSFPERVFEAYPNWRWYGRIKRDPYFINILKHFNATFDDAFCASPEGNVFSKEIFAEIVQVFDRFYNFEEVSKHKRIIYPREEIFFQTIAHLVYKNLRNANTTFTNRHLNKGPLRMSVILDTANGNLPDKYSVKRVARVLDDRNRVYIGEQIGGYREQLLGFLPNS